MTTYADKISENQSQAVTNSLAKQESSGKSVFQFVDNRPAAIAQKKLQETINSNLHTVQLMGKNVLYRGPEIQVRMFRGSEYNWEKKELEKGHLFSKADRIISKQTLLENNKDRVGEFGKEGRKKHSEKSYDPPSQYVSLTDSLQQAKNWAGDSQPKIYMMDLWRSDLWKGGVEDEWLAEGGTKIYNTKISTDRGELFSDINEANI